MIKIIGMKLIPNLIIGIVVSSIFSTTSKINQDKNDICAIMSSILENYEGLDQVILDQQSFNYYETEIVAFEKSLRNALESNLIEEFQKYSPPANDQLISEVLSEEDLNYMANQMEERLNWKRRCKRRDITFKSAIVKNIVLDM